MSLLSLIILCVRIINLQNSDISVVADIQSDSEIILAETRGYIYDRNYEPLVNNSSGKFACLIDENSPNLYLNNLNNRQSTLKNGIFYNISDEFIYNNDDILSYNVVKRYDEQQLCEHIIGYVDADGYGVNGIEKAFDRILDSYKGQLVLKYKVDGNGMFIRGSGPELNDFRYNSQGGVVLTIDKNIQRITEEALRESEIDCGAVVVLKADTAEILASVSVPCYDPDNIEAYINDVDSPFINRVINSYPVGSVFKPIIAAAALENDYKLSDDYFCRGYEKIGNNIFNCYNSKSHGTEYLNDAISDSCNLFFINIGISCGADIIIDIAKNFGFGQSVELCSQIIDSGGYLPEAVEIKSDSQLANLCFGQGELLASPLQIAAAYCVFANGGYYNQPTLMRELVDEQINVYGYYQRDDSVRIIDKEICDIINSCLYNNLLNGTGVNACPSYVSGAGKTATAQTGRYDTNGNELLCTWFAGFVPFENPQYVIVVFNEKGSAASVDCAPVFRIIADSLFGIQ